MLSRGLEAARPKVGIGAKSLERDMILATYIPGLNLTI